MEPSQAGAGAEREAAGLGPPRREPAEGAAPANQAAGLSAATLTPYALAVSSGLLAYLSFPGVGLWPLGFVALLPLLIALEGTTPKRALLLGWITGWTGNLLGFNWLIQTIHVFGPLPLWFAFICYLLMTAANAASWGVFAWITRIARGTRQPEAHAEGGGPGAKPLETVEPHWWWAPVAFVAVEFGWWGVFPYYFGAGLYKVPLLMQGADLTGIVGCTFLFLAVSAALHQAWRAQRGRENEWKRAAMLTAALVVGWTGYGAIRWWSVSAEIDQAPTIKVGMVQTNIGAWARRAAEEQALRTYQDMTRQLQARGVDLIVWPEAAYNQALIPESATNLAGVLGTTGTPAVIGGVMERQDRLEYNAAIALDRDGSVHGSSYKMVMVPFGEYLPFGERFPVLYQWIPGVSPLTPGHEPHVLDLSADGLTIGSLICYEDILPSTVRKVVNATRPNLLVNLTNDSWFGDTREPEIHMALATFRAVESRRTLVRSTISGMTAIVDPLGRVTTRGDQWRVENVVGPAPLMPADTRTVYDTLGDWLGWICLLASLYVIGRAWRERRNRRATA